MFHFFIAWTYLINFRSQNLLYHHNGFPVEGGLKQISSLQCGFFYDHEHQHVVGSLNNIMTFMIFPLLLPFSISLGLLAQFQTAVFYKGLMLPPLRGEV